VGHLDPYFLEVLARTQQMLREVFRTRNELTLAVSGTGTAGMEAAVANLVEEGTEVVVVEHGYFGGRIREMVLRMGGRPIPVLGEWGQPVQAEAVEEALKNSSARVVAVVHAETSTGVLQPLEAIARITHEYQALLLVDTVSSLAGARVEVDRVGIDLCYSGGQKCLNMPPGMAPITASERAVDYMVNHKRPPATFYLDLLQLQKYWANEAYHHTAPINLVYALHEALALVLEEGLEARWERHKRNAQALIKGCEALGLEPLVEEPYRLPTLTTLKLPPDLDDQALRRHLLEHYNIEVGGGLGQLKGKIIRVGLMGINSNPRNVLTLLSALGETLPNLKR
jgi:alanine-glyoxylate transaminase/serine-glyoxylate transaminase/serine-pyruvate transaminase